MCPKKILVVAFFHSPPTLVRGLPILLPVKYSSVKHIIQPLYPETEALFHPNYQGLLLPTWRRLLALTASLLIQWNCSNWVAVLVYGLKWVLLCSCGRIFLPLSSRIPMSSELRVAELGGTEPLTWLLRVTASGSPSHPLSLRPTYSMHERHSVI